MGLPLLGCRFDSDYPLTIICISDIYNIFNKPIAQLGRATLLKCFLGKKINRNYYLAVNPCVIGSNPIRFIENFGVVVQLVETHLA